MGKIGIDSLLIFLVGMLGIWKAIPLGFLLNTNPVIIFIMTSLGAITSVLILYFFGNKIREYILKRRIKKRKNAKESRAKILFEKYGAAGLGFLGCLLMGPNMTMILGLVLVKSQKKLLYWTIAGIIIWTLALTILAIVSIDLFNKIMEMIKL